MDILLVEDSPTDRLVIETRLRRALPMANIMVADDSDQFREHLRQERCDVVVTDYWLGWTDGLSVMQRVRERWPEARAIILTGNGGEEVVASAFNYGLFQYLLKPDGFDELPAVVRAAYEDKRGADARRIKAAIFDSIPYAVYSADPAGIVTAINSEAARRFGYGGEEIVGRAAQTLIPPECRDEVRRRQAAILGGAPIERFATRILRRDGATFATTLTMVPIRGGDGEIAGVASMAEGGRSGQGLSVSPSGENSAVCGPAIVIAGAALPFAPRA
ncbi:MAG: response regulator [Candidatus Binataceae bacterium]